MCLSHNRSDPPKPRYSQALSKLDANTLGALCITYAPHEDRRFGRYATGSYSAMGKFIRPVGKIIWTGAFAVGLTAVSSLIWGGLLLTNLKTSSSVPWAAGVMAVITWAAYRYFGGKWGPDRTKEARRSYLRAAPVSFALFASTVTAGVLCLVSLSGLWIVLFQLVKAPGNSFGDVSHYPSATVIVSLVVAAVSGAVFEEAGFRGYFQGTLEKYLPGPLAIFVCALVMAPEHAQTQGFVWTTVLFYLVSDVMLGF